MTPHALAATLISHAAGLTSDSAAAELICAHHTWLTKTDFATRYIHDGTRHDRHPCAYIDWEHAITALDTHQLSCTPSEAAILRIAASLGLPDALVVHSLRHSYVSHLTEVRYSPFGLTQVEVFHRGASHGHAQPHAIRRHCHPKVKQAPQAVPAVTGIDYLRCPPGCPGRRPRPGTVRVKIDLRLAIAHNASFWAIGKAARSWESDRSAVVGNGG